eukprot:g64662.t1
MALVAPKNLAGGGYGGETNKFFGGRPQKKGMWWPHLSFGASMERRLETLAVFSGSMYFMIPVTFLCWIAAWFLWLLAFPLMLPYFLWIFWLDKSRTTGSRTPFLKGVGEKGNWWRHYADFFPITLVKTAPIPPGRPYIFSYHPHGVISVGAFACFATDGVRTLDLTADNEGSNPQPSVTRRGFSKLCPGIDVRLLTLKINFMTPFFREYILSLGVCDASQESFEKVLAKPGKAVAVVVGGAEESTLTTEHEIDLVLEKRKGFVREAIKAQACLVPTLAFGEADLYKMTHLPPTHPEPKPGRLGKDAKTRRAA